MSPLSVWCRDLQRILRLTRLDVFSGTATSDPSDGNAERRRSETVTWSSDVCLWGRPVSSSAVEEVELRVGWWRGKPLVNRRRHSYPLSFLSLSKHQGGCCLLQSMDRWTDVSGGWTALWVDVVSAVGPVALVVVVSGLCLNKALSKSLRWWGARCLTGGPSVGTRPGQLGLCDVTSLSNICLC